MSPPQERPQGLGRGSGCGQALGLPVWASCLISPSLQAAAEPRTLAALLPPPPPRVLSVQSVPNAHPLRCPQDRATPQPGSRTLWSFRYPVTLGGGGPLPVPCVPEDFVFETCPKVLCPSASQAALGAPICTWRAPRPTSGALRKPLRPCTIYRWPRPHPVPDPGGRCSGKGVLSAGTPCTAQPGLDMPAAGALMQPGITTFPQPPPRQYSPPLEARKVCGEKRRGGGTRWEGVSERRGTRSVKERERQGGRDGDPSGCPCWASG